MSNSETAPAVVIGASTSGLATAACLKEAGVTPVILERSDAVGSAWRGHYDRLHLHTPKAHSGRPTPTHAGAAVGRRGRLDACGQGEAVTPRCTGRAPTREVVSKLDRTGFQPLISMSWRQTQGFALGWYEDALSALKPFIGLRF